MVSSRGSFVAENSLVKLFNISFVLFKRKSNITNKKKTKWQEIAQEFNQSSGISQKRKASHCHERWKNTLNKPYKRFPEIFIAITFF